MYTNQSKVTRHAKTQKNTAYNENNNDSIETDPEMRQNTKFVDMYIEIAIIDIFHMVKKVKNFNMLRSTCKI